ncbi:hypothetical protein GOP47_0002693 [Adiantum capillus-veneris]|uniref:Uncharacterized protein n=1 Tax=Adiantum capillus-veneris TaxID=13818 RepID=A0A9D4VAK3_ADICA|nr:hypothetical protein GOP47_0002693 [Adiantum capillus-veneris]
MDPDANVQLESRNMDHARAIWAGLRSSGYSVPDAFLHLWRIVDLANYARLSPDPPAPPRPDPPPPAINNSEGINRKGKAKRKSVKNKASVYSCISLAVTEDGDELRGASSKLRATMRYNQVHRHGPVGRYKETKDVWGPQGEGAFDEHNHPRLLKKLEEEYAAKGEPMPPPPHAGHPYESCAEQVAFEKASRLCKTPKFLYTVQKSIRFDYVVGAPHPLINKYQVKVVRRCPNCMMFQDQMGHVVTDSKPLEGLHVPVITPSVLKFFRY